MSRAPMVTDRDVHVLRFAGEQYGLPMGVVEELCCRLAPAPLAPGSRETVARRVAGRLEAGRYVARLRIAGRLWIVPTSRGLRMAGLEYERWEPAWWKLDHLEAEARLRLALADRHPDAEWECERQIRARWAGSGARVRRTDGGLWWPDGTACGVELELHAKRPGLYEGIVADQDPAWTAGVWWFTPPSLVGLLRRRLDDAGAGDLHQVHPIPEGVAR